MERPDTSEIAEENPLTFGGEWSIGNAEELRKLLTGFLEPGPDVILDLSAVQACDTAAMQLICSLHRTGIDRGQHIRIAALSPAIVETAAALGLPIPELEGGCRGV